MTPAQAARHEPESPLRPICCGRRRDGYTAGMVGKTSQFRHGSPAVSAVTRLPVRLLGPAVLSLIAAGCATQQYQPTPLDPADNAQQFRDQRLDSPALADFVTALNPDRTDWPPQRWDERSLFLAALFHHPDFAVQRAEWRARQAEGETAARRPPPGVQLQTEYDTDPEEQGASHWSLGGLLNLTFEAPGKRDARIAAARARVDAARQQLGHSAWQLRERVLRRYVEWQDRSTRVRLAALQRLAADQATTLLVERQRAGVTGGLEVSVMRLRDQRARLEEVAARNEVITARMGLASAMGVPTGAIEAIRNRLGKPAENLPTVDERRLRRSALTGRYDLQRELAAFAAADADLRGAVAAQYPDVTLAPGFIYDQGDAIWLLEASWMLLLRGYNDGPIAAARARRDAAAARFRALQARVIGDLDQAVAHYRGQRRVLETANKLLAEQRDYESEVRQRHAAGYVDRLDLLTAQIETLAARRARLDAWRNALLARARLETTAQTTLPVRDDDLQPAIRRFVNQSTADRPPESGP